MSEQMRVAHKPLRYLVSLAETRPVDDLLALAVRDQHVLLLGEPLLGQERVARHVHEISARRHGPFVALTEPPADAAEQVRRLPLATVAIDLAFLPRRAAELFDALFSTDARPRVIACARDTAHAIEMLGPERYPRFAHVLLRPIRARRVELRDLIAQILVDGRYPLTPSAFGEPNLVALEAYDWPENLADLEETIRRAAILMTATSESEAARTIGVGQAALQRYFNRRGLSLPRQRRGRSG